jgi:hypothetical protein
MVIDEHAVDRCSVVEKCFRRLNSGKSAEEYPPRIKIARGGITGVRVSSVVADGIIFGDAVADKPLG